jgi:hypothetical protein
LTPYLKKSVFASYSCSFMRPSVKVFIKCYSLTRC